MINDSGHQQFFALTQAVPDYIFLMQAMTKKSKKLVKYKKYKGVTLTKKGNSFATSVIRKHRLWETFLVNNLNFDWGEVHDLAEQLEHIKSEELVDRLDAFLDYPKLDPHGEPIPTKDGKIPIINTKPLNALSERR